MTKRACRDLARQYNADRTSRRLTLEAVPEVFARTRGEEGGAPDMRHIYAYYHPDVHFRDPVQEAQGREAFIFMMEKLVRRCSRGFSMEVHRVAGNGNAIFMHWTMHMRFMGTPAMQLDGTSILTLDEDGLIVDQRDHYDLWGDSFDAIPVWNRVYRLFMKHVIG